MNETENTVSDTDESYEATEVREFLDRLEERGVAEDLYEAVETVSESVVENGRFVPDCRMKNLLQLTLWERLTGKRVQDMTTIFTIGVMVGAALERDVPTDTELVDVWRDGGFEMPEPDMDDEVGEEVGK